MWHNVQNFTDITYHKSEDGIAKITTVFPGCYPGRWPHLHFEVLVQGVFQDPQKFLNAGTGKADLALAAASKGAVVAQQNPTPAGR